MSLDSQSLEIRTALDLLIERKSIQGEDIEDEDISLPLWAWVWVPSRVTDSYL